MKSSPIIRSTSCIRYSKVIPLRVPLSVKIFPKIELIIRVRDLHHFTKISRFETGFKM